MSFTKLEFTKLARFAKMSAADQSRLEKVFAQATGELHRMTGLSLDHDGRIDLMKLNSALAAWLNAMSEFEIGQNDHRRYLESAKHAMNEVAGSGTP